MEKMFVAEAKALRSRVQTSLLLLLFAACGVGHCRFFDIIDAVEFRKVINIRFGTVGVYPDRRGSDKHFEDIQQIYPFTSIHLSEICRTRS